ncbi:hypothetical protein [Streptomyces sp. TRM68367]|uniref:hypothetical protein n=1 Tax=Streptomyces sp. TRM68367 TaxID=2758415 RepID=UPI00165C4367|nr:hypothetical protein [Streptomyces sp. TRM68367]MBC9731234.1 hypothetical protein [Streptomyces sp. TRM68367]
MRHIDDGQEWPESNVVMGAVLLVVPVIVLASAAGRLGAARREQKLAALRLAGAIPRRILAMTAAEAAAVGRGRRPGGRGTVQRAAAGLAEIPYGLGGWYTDQLWVGLRWLAAIVLAVTALITVSAVSMPRRVATSPGRRPADRPAPHPLDPPRPGRRGPGLHPADNDQRWPERPPAGGAPAAVLRGVLDGRPLGGGPAGPRGGPVHDGRPSRPRTD